MIAGKKTANAVGGKTARACDSCVRKRARWYCAADDAFLCQSCDASVHWASQHERVLLRTASGEPEPSWHQGFTRRARTPRQRTTKHSLTVEGKNKAVYTSAPFVPEIEILEASLLDDDQEKEQLLYRVPVFDPFETELCNDSNETGHDFGHHQTNDLELLEFAADVESLLGKEFDNIEEDNYAKSVGINCFDENKVKVEDKEIEAILDFDFDFDATKETLDWDFDYESSMMVKKEEKKVRMMTVLTDQCNEGKVRTSSIVLRLNHEDVINTWADQGSPWTNGTRPELNSDGHWPYFMDSRWAGNDNPSYGGKGGSDGGREARVSRYREKRRSRLFSKKIRYEVRKINAEKRPRMKGRFVKRELKL